MNKSFTDAAWSDYEYWYQTDKLILKRINKLIDSINSTPFAGLGKPEPLKYELSGKWSRRISQEHRLIYSVDQATIYILSCKDHY